MKRRYAVLLRASREVIVEADSYFVNDPVGRLAFRIGQDVVAEFMLVDLAGWFKVGFAKPDKSA